MRLLLIEDSPRLRSALQKGLCREGYAVDIAQNGREGLWLATENEYDVIVLDLMLPEIDGLTVLERLRGQGKDTHVLILSARDLVEDRVEGLTRGADDYLVKPFSFDEIFACLQPLVLRSYGVKNAHYPMGDLDIHTAARRGANRGRPGPLTWR